MNNGMCKHNLMLVYCPDCWNAYQKKQDEKWWFNLKENADSVKESKKSHDLYVSICGDPIETEQFH